MFALKLPVRVLTPLPSVAVPETKSRALVPFPTAVKMIGEGPKGVAGEQDWPVDNPEQSVLLLPGPNESSVILKLGSLGKVMVVGSVAGVISTPPPISMGSPTDNDPPEKVTVVPDPTSVELPAVSFSVNVMPVGVTVTVPLPPVFNVPTTVAKDGMAVRKMRPKPDPIKLKRARYFIGSSWQSS